MLQARTGANLQQAARITDCTAFSLLGKLIEDQDVDAARRVIADDDLIDRQQYAIEEEALLLIARQAPLAADLRLISAVIAIASELERMGDYAEGIATITIRGAGEPLLKPLIDIPRMAELALGMLREV